MGTTRVLQLLKSDSLGLRSSWRHQYVTSRKRVDSFTILSSLYGFFPYIPK